MEQLLQIRVSAQTVYPEDVVKKMSYIMKYIFGENIPTSIQIEQVVEELDACIVRIKEIPSIIMQQIQRISMLYKALQGALADWQPSKASTLAISLEEALYSLNTSLETHI